MSFPRRNHDFEFDSDGFAIVYIGDFNENFGRQNARAGLGVFFGPHSSLNRSAPVTGLSRLNNIHIGLIRAANTAIYVAALRGCQHLCIRTDSEYLLESVVYMMSGWKRNGWQYRNGEEVENRNDFYELDATVERFAINLKWEYAHSGCYGIECASRLAAESAEIYEIYNL